MGAVETCRFAKTRAAGKSDRRAVRARMARGRALRSFAVPTAPADLATHNNALLKALESRTAYELLRKLLERHCGPRCTPFN